MYFLGIRELFIRRATKSNRIWIHENVHPTGVFVSLAIGEDPSEKEDDS